MRPFSRCGLQPLRCLVQKTARGLYFRLGGSHRASSSSRAIGQMLVMPKPPDRESPEAQKRSFWLQFGRYSQLAFALPAATIAGWFLGSLLDRWLHTSWISVVGLLLGIAAGLIELLRTVSRDMR
jgi:F0F1-type ATP synthase assembly protein I